jgi:hypothetical protein
MRAYLLWCAGTLAFLVVVLKLKSGRWPDSEGLIAFIMASPLIASALWLRFTKGDEYRARAEQAGREFGERHRGKVQKWFGRK